MLFRLKISLRLSKQILTKIQVKIDLHYYEWKVVNVADKVELSKEADGYALFTRDSSRKHKIFMHDTYDKIASMDAYRRIWEQFGLSSNNINGKIAKEIDIIQSIYQFCVYKEMGAEFKDNREEKWRAEKDNIRTEIGRSILKEVVLKRFDI